MAGTKTTTETFPSTVPKKNMDAEVKIRLKIGAISSEYTQQGDEWVLKTVWNIHGQQ